MSDFLCFSNYKKKVKKEMINQLKKEGTESYLELTQEKGKKNMLMS